MTWLEVIENYGDWCHGGHPMATAGAWEGAGFTPEEADEWLEAGWGDVEVAAEARALGIPPAAGKRILGPDRRGKTSSLAEQWCCGQVDPEEALRILADIG